MALFACKGSISRFKCFQLVLLLVFMVKVCLGERNCATLYSRPNSKGSSFPLLDQEELVNLPEDQSRTENGWNVTGSILVENGCKLKTCNETYFLGTCRTMEKGVHSLETRSKVSSAGCSCSKECKCSDVHIRKSRCGRAYLQGGCRTCNSMYTDLFIGEIKTFPLDFAGKVEAFRLRKGCSLTIFSEERFDGEEQIIKEIEENFSGEIGSYKCECDDNLYVPKPVPPRPDSYPPFVDVPESMDDILKMLQTSEYKYHQGLRDARRSYVNRRSSKNAYILLLGSTGAGKSTTINLLFDNPNITRVGDSVSTTGEIHEFRIRVPIDELGLQNTELRVIDTPGLGDTNGLEQDAKFLATLDNYLANHEELKNRIPNVVLVFHKFHDNRFSGEGANFVKMIRGLDMFRERITDGGYSNVIFVFSHFCSETKRTTRKPEARINQFRQVIQDYSLFKRPTHIVVAENKGIDNELFMVNGFYKLPNNEYYPKNLFEKLELVTTKGGDPIGLAVFRTAFRNSENFVINSTDTPLLDGKTDQVAKYLSVLVNANIGVVETEITEHLKLVWKTQVPSSMRKKYASSLVYMQKALNLRNINTFEDVPKTSSDIINLLSSLEQNAATRFLCEKGLNITSPVFPVNTVAGYGYNVFEDKALPSFPFRLGTHNEPSDIGFLIPKSLTCNIDQETREHFAEFENKEAYIQHRLQSLGINGNIPAHRFTDDVKPGYNIRNISFTQDGWSISAAKDFRLFEFELNDWLDFAPNFRAAVKSLPRLNETDPDSVEKWKLFFSTYGTHVVQSVYGGGSINLKIEGKDNFDDNAELFLELVKLSEDLTLDPSDIVDTNLTSLTQSTNQTLTFVGGKLDHHVMSLGNISRTVSSQLFNNWKKSLKYHPIVLTTDMKLKPISQIVRKLGQNYTEEIERATGLLFESELKYKKPSKKTGPGFDRDNTQIMTEEMINLQRELRETEIWYKNKTLQLEEKRLQWEKDNAEAARKHNLTLISMQQEHDRNMTLISNQWDEKNKNMSLAHNATEAEQQRLHKLKLETLTKNHDLESQKAKQRHAEEMARIKKEGEGGGCLKEGTLILMADMTEKPVEKLKVGDIIMDVNFRPTTVLGVAREFLLDQKFYGFDNSTFFFTNNHIFAGIHSDVEDRSSTGLDQNDLSFYAASSFMLLLNNPLMMYLGIKEIQEANNVTLLTFKKELSSEPVATSKQIQAVYEEPMVFPPDTLMYDILVNSPTGTYFANGYACRHELPPFENWPNTMSLLFRLMSTPTFDKLSKIPYTLGTVQRLNEIAEELVSSVSFYFATRGKSVIELDSQFVSITSDKLMTLDQVDADEGVSKVFANPTVSTLALRLYSRVGLVVADFLDNKENVHLTDKHVALIQNELFDIIISELSYRLP